jgi:hypothetical protein
MVIFPHEFAEAAIFYKKRRLSHDKKAGITDRRCSIRVRWMMAMKPRENVAFWRDMTVEGVEICRVDRSRHVFPAHAHDGIYAIGMMLSGGSYCLGPEKAYSLVSPGQIALINPS